MSLQQTTKAQIVFYLMSAVLIAWTASLTYSFIGSVLPHMPWYVPAFALILFDGGMIAWMVVHLHYAQGSWQRGVSFFACILDTVGVGLLVIAEILLGGQQLATAPAQLGEYAVWAVGIWTVANIAAIVTFHLQSPEAQKQSQLEDRRDELFQAGIEALKHRQAEDGARIATVWSNAMFDELRNEMIGAFEEQDPQPSVRPSQAGLGPKPPARPDTLQPPTVPFAIMPSGNGHREEDERPT